MSRIVVVGATGRTGRKLVEMIASRGDTPVAIFRNPLELEAIEKLGGECVPSRFAGRARRRTGRRNESC